MKQNTWVDSRRIFPREGGEKYEKYFQHSNSLFQETAASKAREECARQQLQELHLKQGQKEWEKKGTRKQDLQAMLEQTTLRAETPNRGRGGRESQ
ncbi:hypothetical protein Q8A67_008392 [Cirrhinus molitorella]|uniref:Uncharacterized protein n=1 Tax=Cirrhinus molitorella TaxID=172907 RepID=A0AA88Q3X8_9TELE|nr:hypothetical protein Q8A67_008392 [Cirrhinus molitorella]